MVELSPFRVITDLKQAARTYFVEWFWFEPIDNFAQRSQVLRDPDDPTAATWNPPRQAYIDAWPQNYFATLGGHEILEVYDVSKTWEPDNYVRLVGISFVPMEGQSWTLTVNFRERFSGWAEQYPGMQTAPNKHFEHVTYTSTVGGSDYDQHIPASARAKWEFGVARYGLIEDL
jgi:hypothetical protein